MFRSNFFLGEWNQVESYCQQCSWTRLPELTMWRGRVPICCDNRIFVLQAWQRMNSCYKILQKSHPLVVIAEKLGHSLDIPNRKGIVQYHLLVKCVAAVSCLDSSAVWCHIECVLWCDACPEWRETMVRFPIIWISYTVECSNYKHTQPKFQETNVHNSGPPPKKNTTYYCTMLLM